jgi:Nif-specific regulatory protein
MKSVMRAPQTLGGRDPSTPRPGPAALPAVVEVRRELSSARGLEEQLRSALRVLERRLASGRSVFYVADPELESISIGAIHGLSTDDLRPRYGTGVAGRVAATGRPIVVPTVRHDPMALSEFSDPSRWWEVGWNLITVPVCVSGNCIGALSAYFRHRHPEGFAERLRVLEGVASLLGEAVARAKRGPAPRDERSTPETSPSRPSQEAPFEYANMIGESAVMRQIYEQIGQVARTNATALLRGESGTGKELVARAIHRNSPRAEKPFIKVNCAALPEALFESELFGHERGAFTGAHSRKKGRFELAEGGTLFLDEMGELALTTQAKLLRVLQFREFERLGGTQTLHSDVRVVAATNADMERAVANGTFREDLYYRINVFTITVPPLRDRPMDIPALAEYFLREFATEHQRKISRISSGALDVLAAHRWPGNVRELENVIERAVVVCDGSVIQEHHFPAALRAPVPAPERLTLVEAVDRLERQMTEDALRAEGGSIAGAARVLGTTERVIRYKMRKLGIDPARFRD